MRIVVDLDGVICPVKRPEQSYGDLDPLPGAAACLRDLRALGHYIIIQTARNMGTCQGNVGRVMKNVGQTTLDWLNKHGIEYDEIYFGKPNAEVYIDDRSVRFQDWDEITPEFLSREARPR